jgi:hypothetical protein
MQPTGPDSRRKREPIDEYDLGERFKRWFAKTRVQAVSYVVSHPKLFGYSVVAAIALGVTGWMVANYRPAAPPPPRAAPMRQMMKAVEDADRRVRAEHEHRLTQDPEFRGVFETMRDVPVPIPNKSDAQQNEAISKVPEVQQ